MQSVILLSGKKVKNFCKEINMKPNSSRILIKINENRAEYYNFDDDCFYRLDMSLARKYINSSKNKKENI